MRKLRALFRLRFEAELTTRSIATSPGIGNGTVCDYLGRAWVAKLAWPLPPELDDDAALTALLFPEDAKALAERPDPDWARVHAKLKKKGVTKLLLRQEYLEAVPGGYQVQPLLREVRAMTGLRQRHPALGAPRRGEVLRGLQWGRGSGGGRSHRLREWLRAQSYEQQREFGLRILKQFGAIP